MLTLGSGADRIPQWWALVVEHTSCFVICGTFAFARSPWNTWYSSIDILQLETTENGTVSIRSPAGLCMRRCLSLKRRCVEPNLQKQHTCAPLKLVQVQHWLWLEKHGLCSMLTWPCCTDTVGTAKCAAKHNINTTLAVTH